MGENPTTLVNGCDIDYIDARDRGLTYGDGLFETIAVIKAEPSLWEKHMHRMFDGCRRLALPVPDTDILLSEIKQLADGQNGTAKLVLTRGVGQRGYVPPVSCTPTRIVQFQASSNIPPAFNATGISVGICSTTLACNPLLAGIKHLNRLEQIMAAREIAESEYTDGLMMDMDQNLIEGISSNLFLVEPAGLVTPKLDRCGIAGVMRSCVIETAAELGIKVKEDRVPIERLMNADGLFLTNSLTGILPINRVKDQPYNTACINSLLIEMVRHAAFSLPISRC